MLDFIDELKTLLGEEGLRTDPETLHRCGRDETEDLLFLPQAVALPANTEQVQAVLRWASRHGIPVTPRGAGTGLAGGALPVRGGLVLSMERMGRILDIDEGNLQVTVESGVITEVLQQTLSAKGLFYPPDPSSRGSCFIGGNINTNAGGPRAVKYGVTGDYVLNLEVVLPSGECLWTGANTLKNSTGYNLTRLLVGSEGTLGVVTKAVLRLLPLPTHNCLLLAPFASARQACAAVSAIFRAGITPSCLEFMERSAIDWTVRYLGGADIAINDHTQAHLLIEVDGDRPDVLLQTCERIAEVVAEFGAGEVLFADNQAQKDLLWRLRRNVAHAVKKNSVYKEVDTVVPRAELPRLLHGVKEIGSRYGFQSVCYGHAGDGNLHVNIVRGSLDQRAWKEDVPKGIRQIFELVRGLGGTLSGEHGIGLVQRPYTDIVFQETHLHLMRQIKQAFDPQGILNPNKILVNG